MYVTNTVSVVERTNELATLRAAGAPLGKVAGGVTSMSEVERVLGELS